MKIFGIQFAPLNVPLERRLQTLSAAAWMTAMVFGGPVGLIVCIYMVLFTRLWWLFAIYLFYIWVIDKDVAETGGRPNYWVAKWKIWKYTMEYFPLDIVRLPTCKLDPKKNYFFCTFPHGMVATGVFNFGCRWSKYASLFPDHQPRVVTLTQHYSMPFFRELALSFGGISASARSIQNVISRPEGGYACIILVGGAAEAYYCKPGSYKLVLKNRKGFVKLALRNGTPLVPVLSFGETDLFDQVEGSMLRMVQEKIRKWIGLAPVVPIGRGFFQYSFGIIPRRRPITVVVGPPMDIPKLEKPSNEEIDKYHSRFIEHLTAMFEEQKHNYLENPEEKHLVIH